MPAGVAAAYIAVLSYAALTSGLAAAFGYFTALVLDTLGVSVTWWVLAIGAVALVAVLGYRSVDLSAKVLGTPMVLEFVVLVGFNVLTVAERGGASFPTQSFSQTEVTSGSLGIALMFAFFRFVGFESAALYGEETKDPERSFPRATYIAVGSIEVFYVVTSWIIVGGGCRPDVDTQRLAGEQPRKPRELRALSDGEKPMSADEVARSCWPAPSPAGRTPSLAP